MLAMNTFAIIILFALVLEFSLELTGNILNLKALRSELPPILQGIYKPEDYRKSQEYIRINTRFGLVDSSFTLLLLVVFWFSGGFDWLDQVVRGWDFIPIVTGLLYTGILVFAYSLIKLPLSIYHTFVIEERFGFNRTTPRTFFLDRVKGLVLALLFGGVLLAAILALFNYAGSYAWLYLRYARSVDFPVKNVFVMDGSKRSSKSNAFFTGFGRNKRIALFDTLIAQHNIPEMVAVLAHEIGHYKKKHVLQGLIISILHTGVLLFLLSLFLDSPGLFQAFYMTNQSVYAGLLFFSLLYTPIELALSIVLQVISRKNEYEADRFAAETIDDPRSLVDALKKLSSTNLSNLTPHPFYVFLNYSHPPLLQRVQAIQDVKKKNSPTSV
jgi:STE24 endopeptidase